jgi:hypothetical protein
MGGVLVFMRAAIWYAIVSVATMASYAISSSLILVIHDNMIIGTNHFV